MKKNLLLLWLMLLTTCVSGFAQGPTTITIGTGTSESYNLPINNYYKNSWSEMIYPASDITERGYITSIGFDVSSVVDGFLCNTLTIYMGVTSNEAHHSNTDWLPMEELTEVYSDTDWPLPTATGWLTFDLDNPFLFEGNDNLVIVISKTMPNYTSALKFRYTEGAANCCLYRRSDGNPDDYASHPGGNTGTLTNQLPNLQLTFYTTTDFCRSVTDFAVTDITAYDATFSWIAPEGASNYILQYKPTQEDWESENVITVYPTETSYTLTELSPSTNYSVRIANICGNEYSAWKNKNVTTLCAPETTPYSEDFNAGNTIPNCWEQLTGLVSDAFAGTAPVPNTSTISFNRWEFNSTNVFGQYHPKVNIYYNCNYWLVSPAIDLSNLEDPALTFDLALTAYGNGNPPGSIGEDDRFLVLISTDGGVSWSADNAIEWNITGTGDYALNLIPVIGDEVTISLAQYAGQTIRIAFYGESTASEGDIDLHIDNVAVNEFTTCPRPAQLQAFNITTNSAIISWTEKGEASSWSVEYGPSGFASGSGTVITVTDEPATVLYGLTPSTDYEFRVAANCGETVSYPKSARFRTADCEAITLPFTEEFESYTTSATVSTGIAPACWELVQEDVDMTNATRPQLYYKSAFAHSGDYSLLMNYRGVYAMPALAENIEMEHVHLEMYLRQPNAAYRLQVGVWEDETGAFVPVATFNNSTTGVEFVECDFSNYTGTGRRIAFRNILGNGASYAYSYNYIDDITLSESVLTPATLPYYTDFSENNDQNWRLKNGACTNYWMMGSPDENTPNALFITSDGAAAGYDINNGSTVMAEKAFYMPATDFVHVEFDVLTGGQNYYDYLKVFLTPVDETFDAGTGDNAQSGASYSANALDFSDYKSMTSGYTGDPYVLNLTNGTLHISANMPNPFPNGTGKIVFLWRNNNWSGNQPGAVITNFSIEEIANEDVLPPTVTTDYFYNITTNSAECHGNVTDKGGASMIERGVCWSTSPDPTLEDAHTSNGNGLGEFTCQLTGLAQGTTYYARAYASNLAGTAYGEVGSFATACGTLSLPYSDNFDSYTTNTAVATGVEPICWALVQEDVSMSEENRPQLYYNNAESGNYSLFLNYRGIYAMPELSENFAMKHVKLEMNLQQPDSSYQLQVGVWDDETGTFEPITTFNNNTTGMEHVVCDFSNHTGNGRRIAFCNLNSNGEPYSYNYLDDIELTETEGCEITFEMHDSYGDGWNGNKILIHNDGTEKEVTLDSESYGTTMVTVHDGPIEFEWVNGSYTEECSFTITGSSCLYHQGSSMSPGIFHSTEINCDIAGEPAIPAFSYWTENNCNSVIVHFENNSSNAENASWDFGDGTTSDEFAPVHEYTADGDYVVTVQVNNSSCEEYHSITQDVTVTMPEPVTAFEEITVCSADLPIIWHELEIYEEGEYSTILESAFGCDSTVFLTLFTKHNTLPYFEDFETYTESTSAVTGIEPACWELVQEDVPMTDANRPQLFYDSNYAYSGDYGLLLNYRGVYAMPPFSEAISMNRVKLEMYLRQQETYHALEVGIWEDDGTFNPVAMFNNSTTELEYVECDFSDYTGDGHRIAFRNVLDGVETGNSSCNYIDNIVLTETEGCTLTFEMHDSYGDGWNGNKILIHNYETIQEVTLDSGYDGTVTVTVYEGSLELEWVNGQYTNECSFTITGPSCLYYEGSSMSPGIFHSMEMNCDEVGLAIPAFSYWTENTCNSVLVHFENESTDAELVVWDLVAATSEEYSPVYEYMTDDQFGVTYVYTVSLTVNNSCGHETTIWDNVEVTMPDINITANIASVNEISSNGAVCNGNVTTDECWDINECGVCWNTDPDPTLFNNHTVDRTGAGAFSSTLADLAPGTTYYVRAYATNSMGYTVYGDNVEFTTCGGTIALPYTEDFESYTESTTAATGVEPSCWELVQEDVEMPDTKRPQLYYNSNFTHSGNYSLAMINRGVYAMPPIEDNLAIKHLHLDMYLRQPNAAYRLQVGVWEDETGTFTPVATFNNSTTGVEHVECNFSNYTGNGRRVAFRNVLGSGNYAYSYNYIDDITLSEAEGCELTIEMHSNGDPSWGGSLIRIYTDGSVKEVTLDNAYDDTVTVTVHNGMLDLEWEYNGWYPAEWMSFTVSGPCLYYSTERASYETEYFYSTELYCDGNGTTSIPDFSYWTENVCNNVVVHFENNSTDAEYSVWDFGDWGTSEEDNPSHEYTVSNVYPVTLSVHNVTCDDFSVIKKYIEVNMPEPITTSIDTVVCAAELPITWYGQVIADGGTYSTVFQNAAGCDSIVYMNFNVVESTFAHTPDTAVNANEPVTLWAAGSGDFIWTDADGNVIGEGSNITVIPTENTTYYVTRNGNDQGNLVANGDFEQGNTEFVTAYSYGNYGSCGYYYIGHENHEMWSWDTGDTLFDHTSGTGMYMMVDASSYRTAWWQTVEVTPHTNYVFSAWFLTNNMAYVYFDINGPWLKGFNTPQQRGPWERRLVVWNSGDNNTADIRINTQWASCGGGYDFGIDDIEFYEIACAGTESISLTLLPTGDAQPCPGIPTMTDYDGNVYNTVKIGNQCWMKENLKTTHYADGNEIAWGEEASLTTPYRYGPGHEWDDHSNYVEDYGYLYNWAAVMHGANGSAANQGDVQGVCPDGWHVPSNAEWAQLTGYVGGVPAYQCGGSNDIAKALVLPEGWSWWWDNECGPGYSNENPSGFNATGFGVRPAGSYNGNYYVNHDGNYYEFTNYATFWSSTKSGTPNAWGVQLFCNVSGVFRYYFSKKNAFSVRCLYDETFALAPTVQTEDVSSVASTYATGGGTITNDGGADVTERGVCWSAEHTPTVHDSHTSDGSGAGDFTSILNDLMPGTTYFVRAYATNNIGTGYGEMVSFTTSDCEPITLPYTETFESFTNSTTTATGVEPDCWDLVRTDAPSMPDEKRPQLYYRSDFAHSGDYSLLMNYRCVYAMPALSEETNIPLNRVKLDMYLRQSNAAYQLEVGVWDDATNAFEPVALFNNTTTGVEHVTCDFSNYTGNGRRIAFRNTLCNGKTWSYSFNYIDDITLTEMVDCSITLPYTETFENFTESTTVSTGVEPDCWELVRTDAPSMPDEKRPQLYYRSDFAHSGDYSLLMNYRCVYAMPEISGDVPINNVMLEMYLRQSNAAYLLEVGVWDDATNTFEPVALFNNATTGVEHVTCDFSNYTGSGRRIAFRNMLGNGKTWSYSYNYLDDINLTRITNKSTEVTDASTTDAGMLAADRGMVDILVYPNPTRDYINVECTVNDEQSEVKGIEVIDVYGKVVRTVVETMCTSSLPTQINVSGLAAGMYFVRVTTEKGTVTKAFVKR